MAGEFQEMRGRCRIVLVNRKKETILQRQVNNTIVNTGREMVARLFAGLAGANTLRVKVGTFGDQVQAEHTISDRNFIGEADIQNTEVTPDPETGRARLSFTSTFGETAANEKLQEAGIVFSDGTEGSRPILYNAITFSIIDKQEGDVLTLNWEIFF